MSPIKYDIKKSIKIITVGWVKLVTNVFQNYCMMKARLIRGDTQK